jgi:hypothetical protein
VNFSTGSGGINLKLYAKHYRVLDHDYGIKITPFSSKNVDVIGICYLSLRVDSKISVYHVFNINYTWPIKYYVYEERSPLYENDNLSCKGFADVIFYMNSINETYRINFDSWIKIVYNGATIDFNWGNLFIWIEVIYFSFIIWPLSLLYKSISAIRFNRWHTKEMKQRDEIFFKILEKREKEKDS